MNADLYQRITDRIIAQLEKGVAPWQQTWATVGGGLPKNVVSRKHYRGINTLLLWSAAEEHRYESNLWATYRQWDALGGHVKRGEHGTKIIYWNVTNQTVLNEETGKDEERRRLLCREYTVFNLDQCGGESLDRYRIARPVRDFVDFGPAEEAIRATGADIFHGGNRAFYNPLTDCIYLPHKEAFDNEADYYAVALHELAHWTSHERRLSRLDKLARFGDKSYATEELVAELAGAFLTGALKIPNDRTLDSAAAYLAHWLTVLRSDSKAIFTAATAASAAADYILAFSGAVESEPAEIAA